MISSLSRAHEPSPFLHKKNTKVPSHLVKRFSYLKLASLKLTWHLKMVGWNTIVSFWDGLFSGAMLVLGSAPLQVILSWHKRLLVDSILSFDIKGRVCVVFHSVVHVPPLPVTKNWMLCGGSTYSWLIRVKGRRKSNKTNKATWQTLWCNFRCELCFLYFPFP